jgi:pilus assembly protein CpaC
MPRILLLLILALVLLLSGAFAGAATSGIPLRTNESAVVIGLGESVRLDVSEGSKIHVSDGTIVRTRLIGKSLIMTGRKVGRTSLRLLGTKLEGDKTLFVSDRKTASTVRLFQRLLQSRRGLRLSDDAFPAIVVKGELLRLEDWLDLVAIARETKIPWRLEATIFEAIRKPLITRIESELTRLAWPGQRLSVGEKGPTLTGGSESKSLTTDQKLGVTVMGIQLETSPGLTELEPMIRTQIVIAEVRRNRVRELGVRWPDVARASVLPSLQMPTEALMVDLQAMEQEGEGRILAMPTLLCRSGGEAKFLAGGEIPIKLTSIRSAQVEWKKYGITLHVQPKADRMKRMKFQLTTEISTLDKATEMDGVPGVLTNRIETQFNLNGPQTIVLSGLIKREEGESANGLPLLRSIPILGSLFGSENFRKNLTELLVFVSPQVVIQGGGADDGF